MRLALLGPADGDISALARGAASALDKLEADRVVYLGGDDAMDQVVSVRVLHHLVDVPAAFAEIARVLSRGGTYVTEFASKRHLKAIARYLLNRQPPITVGSQRANPFSPDPYEFAALNFDFHPRWIERALQQAGLKVEARRAVSHFRVTSLKRLVPLGLLVAADRALQRAGAVWPWTPSLFIRARKP
ncbi:MAG: methyltransferase domain-containing protein [Chloroflexi bacterium]|nr:methyltransferase domain-containing protein [Chloroflexota bacterium]